MTSADRTVRTADAERAAAWFYTRHVGHGVWLIAEPQHVYTWLVEGSERAVILDTGMGILPIRPVVQSVTPLPTSVVNTHYHFDHIGGNWEFEDIAIHEIGAPLAAQAVPRELLDLYVDYARRQIDAAAAVRPLDREFLWLLSPESDPRPFPADWNPDDWTIRPSRATQTLRDGDRIDLGDRSLTVIHAPGHSPDGICLFDEHEGLLFAGDSSNAGPIYAHFPDSSLEDLGRSARRLADLADEVDVAFFHHYGRPVAERDLFGEIAAGVEVVEAGDADLTPGVDIIGTPMLEARFDHFSVTVPDPDADEAVLTVQDGAA
jgi:glyoxylase-like metal-dependent hydrolase (beta-lactamase superfamily II)